MPKSVAALGVMVVLAAGACESDPTGPILEVQGTYEGEWTFDVFLEGVFVSRAVCPGSITLDRLEARTFGGAFTVRAEGDCTDLSPLSGEVVEGAVRGDGGVSFQVTRLPVVGAGVAGCTVVLDPEAEMNGAVEGTTLSVFGTARLECEDETGAAQVRMTGTR